METTNNTASLHAYLMFNGNCEDAMNFYKIIFGGNLDLNRFGDSPGGGDMPVAPEKIMHAALTGGEVELMGSDGMDEVKDDQRRGIALSISGFSGAEAKLKGYWEGLCDGGTIMQPLVPAPWGDTFGMVTDKYGFTWMVNISGKASAE